MSLTKRQATASDSVIATRIKWLAGVRLFEGVAILPGALEHIAPKLDERRYAKGTAILKEGEEGTDAFILTSGRIKVLKSIGTGESFPVAILDAGDHPFFGEAALLQADQRSATILAETDCVCLIFHKDRFDQFCREHPAWSLPMVLKIARVVLDRLHKTNTDMILLYNALLREVKG